jgi:Flp pilus assembly protein TadG
MRYRPARLGCARCGRRGRRGTACVEFAVLLPFLLFVFAVGADWCRIYYAAHTLDECARSGALAASGLAYQERDLTSAERESRGKSAAVANGADLFPDLEAGEVTVTPDEDYVTVTVTYDFHMILPALGNGGTWTITRSVRMPLMP